MNHQLAIYKDELAPQAVLSLPVRDAVRAIYVIHGGLRVRSGDFEGVLGGNSAFHAAGTAQLAAGDLVTWLLRWELTRAGAADASAAGAGVASRKLLTVTMALDAEKGHLLRCERVELPPDGEIRHHTYLGKGIACLLAGGIDIHSDSAMHRYAPLEPWQEAGPGLVRIKACPTMITAFVRVMLLPRESPGQPSIAYAIREDLDKPAQPACQRLFDVPVTPPA